MSHMYTHAFPTSLGTFYLAATEDGLCNITFPGHGESFREWTKRNFRKEDLVPDAEPFREVTRQLEEYFLGDRQTFELPLYLIGTDFQKKVWNKLREIPYGTTWSYLDLARKVGVGPTGCRAVGSANGKNPVPIVIPCHRVIGKDGSMTGFGGGIELKRKLLELEGAIEGSRQQALAV